MKKRTVGIILICMVLLVFSGCRGKGKEKVVDEISGYSWKAAVGSLLCLESDGTFKWYRNENNRDDSYYLGTYNVYKGTEAVKYISEELKQYNITSEMQLNMFLQDESRSITNYYCMVLNNDECIVDGKNTLKEKTITPFLGFYYAENEYLDFYNLNTQNYSQFKKYTE